ncbi:MAG TPA: hypothetical protein VKG23_02840 [Thermoanaerobaculia bacterium]|nr:hypothetical protein [Thermoanaerobaculia bacterium]
MIRWPRLRTVLIAAAVFACSTAPALRASDPPPAPAWRTFVDVDGKPLPFKTDAELLEFLRTAEPTAETHLSGGINFPRKVVLEKDGLKVNAVFRDVNEEKDKPTFGGGRNEVGFSDSYIYEPAAYEMGLMLGLDNVPPATLRKLHYKSGSIQIFVNGTDEKKLLEKHIEMPKDQMWQKQVQMMNVFDALIYNVDRNRGNILITPDWRLWMIDHTRAFRKLPTLQEPVTITMCERGVYQKLKALDEKEVRTRMKPYLSSFEIDGLIARRKLLVDLLDKLIAEKGENQVLYDFTFVPAEPAAAPAAAANAPAAKP